MGNSTLWTLHSEGIFLEIKIFLTCFCLKCPYRQNFYFLTLSIYRLMNFCEKKIDLDKMQSLLEVSQTFKFAANLVHYSHQSSLIWNELRRRLRNT